MPYVLVQNNSFIAYNSHLLNALQRLNDWLAGKFVVRHAAEVLAVSRQTQVYAGQLERKQTLVCYRARSTRTPSSPRVIEQAVRSGLGLPTNAFVILTVGRLTFRRGVDTLLMAAELLVDSPAGIIRRRGDGLLRQIWSVSPQRAINNCRLHRCCAQQCFATILSGSRPLRAVVTHGGGIARRSAEAWAGTPLIATAIGWQVGVVENGCNALLIPARAPEHLAQAIRWCVKNPASVQRIGEAGRPVLRHF